MPAAIRCRLMLAAASVSCLAVPNARAEDSVGWQAYADCAAGYRANWQDRLSDPTRTPEMRDTIAGQSEDYATAAVRHYREQTGATVAKGKEVVEAYMHANLERFIALDKRDELNAFLDKCPQPDESGVL